MKKMHISENKEIEKVEQNSKEPSLDVVGSGDDISDEWTMMDIGGPGSKCQSGTYFYLSLIYLVPKTVLFIISVEINSYLSTSF